MSAKCGTCPLQSECAYDDMVAYGALCLKAQCGTCYYVLTSHTCDAKPLAVKCPSWRRAKTHEHGRAKRDLSARGGA